MSNTENTATTDAPRQLDTVTPITIGQYVTGLNERNADIKAELGQDITQQVAGYVKQTHEYPDLIPFKLHENGTFTLVEKTEAEWAQDTAELVGRRMLGSLMNSFGGSPFSGFFGQ